MEVENKEKQMQKPDRVAEARKQIEIRKQIISKLEKLEAKHGKKPLVCQNCHALWPHMHSTDGYTECCNELRMSIGDLLSDEQGYLEQDEKWLVQVQQYVKAQK